MRRSAFISAVARAFAAGVVALAGCSPSRKTKADLDAFMARSRKLTGYADLDPQLGAKYLDFAGPSPSDRAILTLWYTGIDGSRNATVTWTGALAWRACRFTKPPSLCAAPGSWHERPASA
ncbi:MAG TPA: sugar dehydrogenase complex small subunit [Candidatus Baltobacteraceae bacterium]|nr:sugar dehydrogenase complex small subunit [Candidatus Baltobacteraceae bacterium]